MPCSVFFKAFFYVLIEAGGCSLLNFIFILGFSHSGHVFLDLRVRVEHEGTVAHFSPFIQKYSFIHASVITVPKLIFVIAGCPPS